MSDVKEECSVCCEERNLLSHPDETGKSTNCLACSDCWIKSGKVDPKCPFCRKPLSKWLQKQFGNIQLGVDPIKDDTLSIDLINQLRSEENGNFVQFLLYDRSSDLPTSLITNSNSLSFEYYQNGRLRPRRREGPSVHEPSVSGPSVHEPSVSGPSVSRPSVHEPSVSGPSVSGPSVSGPSVSRPSVSGPTDSCSTTCIRNTRRSSTRGSNKRITLDPRKCGEFENGRYYCNCGSNVTSSGAQRHLKTQKHKNWESKR